MLLLFTLKDNLTCSANNHCTIWNMSATFSIYKVPDLLKGYFMFSNTTCNCSISNITAFQSIILYFSVVYDLTFFE
ncbi:hypothetical protein XENTR_v10013025 [Xenopus tropicalis]|nr:hypothetical protein XENTR_v10013025 [Xenopus tropicalis]